MTTPTTEQRLLDLVDIAAHLHLRLTTSQPGQERVRSKTTAAEQAPANVGVLHALDARVKLHGDDMPAHVADEHWRCQHHTHRKDDCPHENDDDGRQGLLPDLWLWARMIENDLLEAWTKTPEELPDPATLATVCSWLAEYRQPWADLFPREGTDFDRDVRRWHDRLRNELGEHDPPTLRHTNLGGCGDVLSQLADGIRWECRGCRDVLTLPEMLGLARWHAEVTIAEASEMLGIPRGTLDRWVHDGKLTAVRTRRPALYALRDIRAEQERLAKGRAG